MSELAYRTRLGPNWSTNLYAYKTNLYTRKPQHNLHTPHSTQTLAGPGGGRRKSVCRSPDECLWIILRFGPVACLCAYICITLRTSRRARGRRREWRKEWVEFWGAERWRQEWSNEESARRKKIPPDFRTVVSGCCEYGCVCIKLVPPVSLPRQSRIAYILLPDIHNFFATFLQLKGEWGWRPRRVFFTMRHTKFGVTQLNKNCRL